MKHIRAKVILLGRSGVGKTSLVRRYISNEFSERHVETLGVRVEKRVETMADAKVELMLWDLAGGRDGDTWDQGFVAGAAATLYVVDQSDPNSFADFQQFIAATREQVKTPISRLLLNKSDLTPAAELPAMLASLDANSGFGTPQNVSAKLGDNVAQVFADIAQQLCNTP